MRDGAVDDVQSSPSIHQPHSTTTSCVHRVSVPLPSSIGNQEHLWNRHKNHIRTHTTTVVASNMPTPESEQFLAQKPKVPPTFDGVDYDNNLQLKAAQDSIIREQWVQSMMARLIREEMGKCYAREGVNHLEKCGMLRGVLCPRWDIPCHAMLCCVVCHWPAPPTTTKN